RSSSESARNSASVCAISRPSQQGTELCIKIAPVRLFLSRWGLWRKGCRPTAGLCRRFAPVPGVLEGLDLRVADGAGLFAEEDVVGGLRVEGRVEADEADGV